MRLGQIFDLCLPAGWSDVDPADTTADYSWQWTVDAVSSVTTQTIDGSSFDAGDVIQCTATPYDEAGPGSAASSGTVTVGNTEPSFAGVSINPSSGNETSTFSCEPSGWFDADGDPEGYTFTWFVNLMPSVTSQTITGSSFDEGDILFCEATPFDGTDFGSPLNSNLLTVDNSPPSVASASIFPPSGTETSTFSCLASGWSDPDSGDVEDYLWEWRAGTILIATTETITGNLFDKGDILTCTAVPWDGSDTGPEVTSSPVVVAILSIFHYGS